MNRLSENQDLLADVSEMKHSESNKNPSDEKPKSSRRGLLIVFEGCDRSGKSTQAKLLDQALRSEGLKVQLMRFPERTTKFGNVINSYLKKEINLSDHIVHLAFSVNRWEFNKDMRERLNNGETLIIDRYAYSGVAYTSAKGKPINWCRIPDSGLPTPDRVFYLDAHVNKTSSRSDYGSERYEKIEFQEKVYNKYNELKDDSWHVMDAERSIDDIHLEIKKVTLNLLGTEASVGSLWVDDKSKVDIEKYLEGKEDSEDCVAFLQRLAKDVWTDS